MGDHGDEWDFQRIGTQSEKSSVEKELAELRERLAKVEEWKKRREEIEAELNRVWVEGKGEEGESESEELAPPPYLEREQEADTTNIDDDDNVSERYREEAVESESEGIPTSD
jgi:ATP-binding cassette subfamily D (ALD) long-chain fatty acid import protein